MIAPDALRQIPSVHELALRLAKLEPSVPPRVILMSTRSALAQARRQVLDGESPPRIDQILEAASNNLKCLRGTSLRSIINATGVVLHTNLGRAPLGSWLPYPGYCNLEFDLSTGRRGKRDAHLDSLLDALLEKPAIAVNNGAAATFLALHELAAGYEVIVSRGELIEIGDGFRIPDILSRSGAILREVGTSNRTRIDDYRDAINERTRLLLRVHPSNFHISGFTGKPTLPELVELGKQFGVPLYEDLGSGNVVDLRAFGITEPLVTESLRQGVNLVSFSGDKLLGGPQAGVLAGDAPLIQRLRRSPVFRAFRLDKLVLQSLESTLRNLLMEDWAAIPSLRMLRMTDLEIADRARRLFPNAELIAGESVIGGGSTPDQSIPTTLVIAARENAAACSRALRLNNPPIIGRIADNFLLLDLRTVLPEEEQSLRVAVLTLPCAAPG